MPIFPGPRVFPQDRATRNIMHDLFLRLQQEQARSFEALHIHNCDSDHVQAFNNPLLRTAVAFRTVRTCLQAHKSGTLASPTALAVTQALVADYGKIIALTDNSAARMLLSRQLAYILEAQARITSLAPLHEEIAEAFPAEPSTTSTITRIVVRSDWLQGIKALLFPVERMVVGAGRIQSNAIVLGAVFDVTGARNSVHVEADLDKLFQARLAMEATGTHLAAWVHSHPGTGAGATYPSQIDTSQHSKWLRMDQPSLLSAIMVVDDYVRFWGTALETNQVELVIEGPGIERVSTDGHIYRLTPAQ